MSTSRNASTATKGWVYWIKEREFVRLQEDVWKIGRTTNWAQRYAQYPKGSVIMAMIAVHDCKVAEDELIKGFRRRLIARPDIGREYFQGESHVVGMLFCNIASQFICDNISTINHDTSTVAESLSTCSHEDDNDTDSLEQSEPQDPTTSGSTSTAVEAIHGVTNDFDLNLFKYVSDQRAELEAGPIKLTIFYDGFVEWVRRHPCMARERRASGEGTMMQAVTSLKKQFGVATETSEEGILLRFDATMRSKNAERTSVLEFAQKHVVRSQGSYFTLAEAKVALEKCGYTLSMVSQLKSELEKALGVQCRAFKWRDGAKRNNVFDNHKLDGVL